MTVQNIVEYQKERENKNHAHKIQVAQSAIDYNKNEQTVTGNLLRVLKENRADIKAASKQRTPTNTLPPRPPHSSPIITTNPSTAAVPHSTLAYKKQFTLSKQELYDLANTAPKDYNDPQNLDQTKRNF